MLYFNNIKMNKDHQKLFIKKCQEGNLKEAKKILISNPNIKKHH